MDAPIRLRYEGNGDFRVLSNYWAMRADRDFVVGEVYPMLLHQERSAASHNHYFATLANGWANLPDDKMDEYPTPEHLRKKLLVWCGYADERSIVCSSKAEAQRVAAFVKPSDPYAVVTVREAVVRVFTAQSQSVKAMGAKAFQESKQAVLDKLDDMLGVERGTTASQARAA